MARGVKKMGSQGWRPMFHPWDLCKNENNPTKVSSGVHMHTMTCVYTYAHNNDNNTINLKYSWLQKLRPSLSPSAISWQVSTWHHAQGIPLENRSWWLYFNTDQTIQGIGYKENLGWIVSGENFGPTDPKVSLLSTNIWRRVDNEPRVLSEQEA